MFRKRIGTMFLLFFLLVNLAACGRPQEPTGGTLPGQSEGSSSQTVADSTTENRTQPTTSVAETTTEAPLQDYSFDPLSTGIYVTRDGVIKSAEVTSFDNKKFKQTRYDEAELKSFLEQEIKEYNDIKQSEAVKLESLSVSEGMATLVLDYSNFNYFLEFQGSDFGVKYLALMSRENAVKNYSILNLVDTKGEPTELLVALAQSNIKVLVVTGSAQITVNGDILYVSDGMVVTDKNVVRCVDDINYSFVVFR